MRFRGWLAVGSCKLQGYLERLVDRKVVRRENGEHCSLLHIFRIDYMVTPAVLIGKCEAGNDETILQRFSLQMVFSFLSGWPLHGCARL